MMKIPFKPQPAKKNEKVYMVPCQDPLRLLIQILSSSFVS